MVHSHQALEKWNSRYNNVNNVVKTDDFEKVVEKKYDIQKVDEKKKSEQVMKDKPKTVTLPVPARPSNFGNRHHRVAHVPKTPEISKLPKIPKPTKHNQPVSPPAPQIPGTKRASRSPFYTQTSPKCPKFNLDSIIVTPPSVGAVEEPEDHSAEIIRHIINWKPKYIMDIRYHQQPFFRNLIPVPLQTFGSFSNYERYVKSHQ